MSNKKNICLVTNWYPSDENPFAGLFFREQAIAEADRLNYYVVHINVNYKRLWIQCAVKRLLKRQYNFKKVKEEYNIEEYSVYADMPIFYKLADIIYDLWKKIVKKETVPGVGKYISKIHQKANRKLISDFFLSNFQDKLDVMYCIDAQNEASTIRYAAEALNIPFIIGEHAPVPWPGSVITDENKAAMEKANLFLAISQDKIRQVLLQNIKLRRIEYIGNLIDESQFKLSDDTHSVKTLLIVAAHSFYKNYNMFIAAINRLTEITNVPFKVIIAGYAANKGYAEGVKAFESQIHSSKFSDRVELIPEVPHKDIQKVYNRADAFIMTSIQEGQPVSAMEAACCGLPIFSTRCGGVEDYVDDNIGRIYNITDVEGMANGLKDYLEGRITFSSTEIRNNIVEKFGKQNFVNKFVEAIDSTCEEHQ